MTPTVLALLFTSAALHAGWNLLVKGALEKLLVTWLSLLSAGVCFLPALFFVAPVAPGAWGYVMASALLEVAYFLALTSAYRLGDFTLVYPLARGGVPALLACWSVLFLGERLSGLGLLGLAVLVIGLLCVGGSALLRRHGAVHGGAVAASLLVALILSVLVAVDGRAVKQTPPFSFTLVVFLIAPLLAAPFMVRIFGIAGIARAWQRDRGRILLVGNLSLVSYALALAAYSRAPVAYAGAIREVGIVLGALAGWRFLGEELGAWRVAGAVLTFAGVLVIALAR